ncbi:MAG: hypothetical protein AAFU70_01240 [Planctomycetota bacterium]
MPAVGGRVGTSSVPESEANPPKIAGCILLAGGLVPSPLVEDARCPSLELSLTARQTVFDRWCDVLFDATVGDRDPLERPRLQVVHSGPPYRPRRDFQDPRFEVVTQEEPGSFRGPGGVLRDVTESYGDDDILLVAEAARYIAGGLCQFIADWARLRPDILMACHPGGEPAGLMLVRRGSLELVPSEGFMDVKEQWLPKVVRAGLKVWTSETRDFQPYPLRTREQFLRASAVAAGLTANAAEPPSVLGPPRVLGGGIDKSRVAQTARVAPGAVIADAIVMPGAVIGTGAIVVRSIVCPDAVIEDNAEVVDRIIPAAA